MRRFLIALVALAFVAVACGGDGAASSGVVSLEDNEVAGGDDPVASLQNTNGDDVTDEEALLAFAACMRDNGVDVEDPTVDNEGNLRIGRPRGGQQGGEVDGDAIRAAFDECGDLIEGVIQQFRGGDDQTERNDQLLAFAECMRENGYEMPDPDFSATPGQGGPGQGGGPFGEIDTSDPAFETAQAACEDLLPGGGGFGGGAGRGPGGNNG